LTNRNCHITVVPYHYTAEQIERLKPNGIVVTSGPGSPANIHETVHMAKEVIGKIPFFGIGLGHHIFALATGAKVKKMHVGHSGTSYPVKDIEQGKTVMTTQNHQYEVIRESIDGTKLLVSHENIND